jgi:predicted ATPase
MNLLVTRPAGGRQAPLAPVHADWSYALLDEADRAVLRRISVFAARSPRPRRKPCW